MKKLIVIFLSLSLLSLFVIPCFAEDITFTGSTYDNITVILDGVTYSTSSRTNSITIPVSPGVTHSISGTKTEYGNTTSLEFGYRDSGTFYLFSTSSSDPTFVSTELSSSLRITGGSDSVYFFTLEGDPESPVDLSISTGVSSFIDWTGSVFSNIINNPAILVLVGLSIGMLAILPWGISKIKQLIKGY